MNRCSCGCGGLTRWGWVRGHNRRGVPPGFLSATFPIQRVLPLAEFLIAEYGSIPKAAKVSGISRATMWNWQVGRTQHVSPKNCRRIVAAVKAQEARLRDEADQEAVQARRDREAEDRRRQRAEKAGVSA